MIAKHTENWFRLSPEEKVTAVETVITMFRERTNIAILKPPAFYARRMDQILNADPLMTRLNLPTLMQNLASAEYDFYNGRSKEDLAKRARSTVGSPF